MIIYNEMCPEYRSPVGAVPAGGSIRFSIKSERNALKSAELLLWPDHGEAEAFPMRFIETKDGFDLFSAEAPFPRRGLFWYCFRLADRDGNISHFGAEYREAEYVAPFQVTVYEKAKGALGPEGGLIYHIFVDRFKGSGRCVPKPGACMVSDWYGNPLYDRKNAGDIANDDFFGGDLYGIAEKLPYIKSLGCSIIYLSPIFEADSNHKYDTNDYMAVDSMFGGDEAFRELCAKAADMGMHVILDGVFSHVGANSIYFNKSGRYGSGGAYNDKNSPYYKWFSFRKWPDDYACWWNVKNLPSMNKDCADYAEYITGRDGVARHWLRMGASGFRLDVADELPDSFLDKLCTAVKDENPDALIVGEVWEDASNKTAYGVRRRYFQGGQLDSVTNYPLRDGIIDYIKNGGAGAVSSVLEVQQRNYPPHIINNLMNIVGTHDTPRIITVLGADELPQKRADMAAFSLTAKERKAALRLCRIAAMIQFTAPGIPCVYYGDEAGLEGCADPFNRRGYPWGREDKELLSYYRALGSLRERSALREGSYKTLYDRDGVLAYEREADGDRIAAFCNMGGKDVYVSCGTSARDILSGKTSAGFTIPPRWCILLEAAPDAGRFVIRLN